MENLEDLLKFQQIQRQQLKNLESPAAQGNRNDMKYQGVRLESFPIHLFPPRGAETFDIRESFNLSSPTVSVTLIDWTTPIGTTTFWRAYSLFSNVPAGVSAEWTITVDGQPSFKFHGSSVNDFRKTLALGSDLSSEIDALCEIRGGQRIVVVGSVSSSVSPCTIAARIRGWVLSEAISIKRVGS